MINPVKRPPTLSSAVVYSIRESILKGQFKLGDPLREVELGTALDVSRITVREALRELQEEKIIHIIPHRGAFVVELTMRLAKELYSLLMNLESFAIELGMSNETISHEDLDLIETIANQADELQQDHVDRFVSAEIDVAFHKSLCGLSNNQLLIELHSSLQSLRLLFLLNHPVSQIRPYDEGNPPDHQAIVLAIRRGNVERAIQAIRNHLGTYSEALLRRMKEDST